MKLKHTEPTERYGAYRKCLANAVAMYATIMIVRIPFKKR